MLLLRAYLLVYCLLKLIVVEDGTHLPVAVAGPVGGGHLHLGLTHIRPTKIWSLVYKAMLSYLLVS